MGPVDDFILLVKTRFAATYGELVKARGLLAIAKLFGPVIKTVEEVALEGVKLSGAEKKEAAVAILNELIDIPLLPEWIEAKVISLIIDAVVEGFNSIFSKLWIKKVEPVTP